MRKKIFGLLSSILNLTVPIASGASNCDLFVASIRSATWPQLTAKTAIGSACATRKASLWGKNYVFSSILNSTVPIVGLIVVFCIACSSAQCHATVAILTKWHTLLGPWASRPKLTPAANSATTITFNTWTFARWSQLITQKPSKPNISWLCKHFSYALLPARVLQRPFFTYGGHSGPGCLGRIILS